MKATFKYTFAIAVTLFYFNTSQAQFKKVKGNGTITTKTHTTSDYNEVKVIGFMDVLLESGTEGLITVKTDENLQEYIDIKSKKGVLTIKVKNSVNIQTKKGVHVTVPFKDLDAVSLTGSGDVLTSTSIKGKNFEAELIGSGDMILEVDAETIDAKITGSGDLNLSGKVTNLEIKVTGSGDFSSKTLISQNTQVYVSGSGDAIVHANKSLKARVNGSGDIIYYGNPESTDNKTMGSGAISSN